jgi:hypothetical protein
LALNRRLALPFLYEKKAIFRKNDCLKSLVRDTHLRMGLTQHTEREDRDSIGTRRRHGGSVDAAR